MKKIEFWVARAPRYERTPGYLIYKWLDGRPPPPFAYAHYARTFNIRKD